MFGGIYSIGAIYAAITRAYVPLGCILLLLAFLIMYAIKSTKDKNLEHTLRLSYVYVPLSIACLSQIVYQKLQK
jgi:hypothetical protein